jgi:hypothetical protein
MGSISTAFPKRNLKLDRLFARGNIRYKERDVKPKFKELVKIIVENTHPSMSRMEAWEAVAVIVPDLTWESFKRIQPLAERKRK